MLSGIGRDLPYSFRQGTESERPTSLQSITGMADRVRQYFIKPIFASFIFRPEFKNI